MVAWLMRLIRGSILNAFVNNMPSMVLRGMADQVGAGPASGYLR